MSRFLGVLTALVAAAALTSCASSAQPSAKGTGSPVAGGSHQVHHVLAGDADNGKTVTLAKGDTLVLRLQSTYWRIATPSGSALHLVKRSTHAVPMGPRACVPGGGCGTVAAQFQAQHSGRTEVIASRTTCGEAMRCVGSTGHYRLTVVVH